MNPIEQIYSNHEGEPIIDVFETIVMQAQVSEEKVWDYLLDRMDEKNGGEYGCY